MREANEIAPASVTNCPVCPGLIISQDVVHPVLSQANQDGWSFSHFKLITEPGVGPKLQVGLSAFSCGHQRPAGSGSQVLHLPGGKLSFLIWGSRSGLSRHSTWWSEHGESMIVNKLPTLIISSRQFQLKKTEQEDGRGWWEAGSGCSWNHQVSDVLPTLHWEPTEPHSLQEPGRWWAHSLTHNIRISGVTGPEFWSAASWDVSLQRGLGARLTLLSGSPGSVGRLWSPASGANA